MTIERGIRKFNRKRAQNFIQDIAQKRLEETVEPLNAKSRNSLQVNAHDAIIYTRNTEGPTCTCEETKVVADNDPKSIPEGMASPQGEKVFTIDRSYNLFGERGHSYTNEDEGLSARADAILEDDPVDIVDNILGGHNEDCGICYSIGKVPGYVPYMWQRELLESHFVLDNEGYWIDTSTSPHTFKKQDPQGFVEFGISIPKYWNRCLFSVRNNRKILKDNIYVGNNILTRPILDANRGRPINVQIKSEEWTHAVIAFDLGVSIQVSISEITHARDYNLFEFYSGLTVIAPPEITKLNVDDVFVLPKFNVCLKINDISRKRTSHLTKYAEWSAQTRVLQPQEALRHIHDGTPF